MRSRLTGTPIHPNRDPFAVRSSALLDLDNRHKAVVVVVGINYPGAFAIAWMGIEVRRIKSPPGSLLWGILASDGSRLTAHAPGTCAIQIRLALGASC